MSLDIYKTLIASLPVRQQSFTTKRSTWLKAEKEISWLKGLNDTIFDSKSNLTISREDIFGTENLRELILKTIYWGYTPGMRGNHFVNILKKIEKIESALNTLRLSKQPTNAEFEELSVHLKEIDGLGLSTFSKILYFLGIEFNGNPCLILDQRLIDVFSSKIYPEFAKMTGIRYGSAEKKYIDFLEMMNQQAKKLETKGENIEQFLYLFGKNLKP